MKRLRIYILCNISKFLYHIGDLFSKFPWYWTARLYGFFMRCSSWVQEKNYEVGAWKPLSQDDFERQFGYHSEYFNLIKLEETYLNDKCRGLCDASSKIGMSLDYYYIFLRDAYSKYANKSVVYYGGYWFPKYEKRQRLIVINLAKHMIIKSLVK